MKINIDKLLGLPVSLYEKFHRKTMITQSISYMTYSKVLNNYLEKVFFKGYSRFESIKLPVPKLKQEISLLETLLKRKSTRNYLNRKISLDSLSTLLFFSSGLRVKNFPWLKGRFYP